MSLPDVLIGGDVTAVWTYVSPPANDKDRVRFLIGDTDPNEPLLPDSTVDYAVTLFPGSIYSAAAFLADGLAAFWGAKIDKTVGRLSLSYQARYDHYTALSKRLRDTLNGGLLGGMAGTPLLGGGGGIGLGTDIERK